MVNQDKTNTEYTVANTIRGAQELIAEIWAQKCTAPGSATRVIVTPAHYRILQKYRSVLGDLPDPNREYLQRYSIFNLEFCIDADTDSPKISV